MITKLSLLFALAFVAATIASSAFAQTWYSGSGRHHYYSRYGSNVAPSHTGGGSFGYNVQVERDY
jgi:hypothetical protein